MYKTIVVVASFLVSSYALAQGAPVTFVFNAGDPIRASEMNSNFQELADRIAAMQAGSVSAASSLYIFNASTLVDGASGRANNIAACKSIDAASSFCSAETINNAIRSSVQLSFSPGFTGGWLDSADYSNCQEHTNNSANFRGATISASASVFTSPEGTYVGSGNCDRLMNVVCCKSQ